MAFDSGTTNAGSGGLTLAVNTFTDADAVARTAPFSQLAFGVMDAIPTIVSASNGLPVAQQGTWNVGTVTTVSTVSTVTTVGAVTAITNALPAGSNVIGGVTQSGTWNVTNVSGTISLPTGASTAAKQPALGTAGTASADVLTVQGIASMTALKVDGSAVTQPVSGTVTATVSGVSTAANQTTIIGHVDGIETLLGTIDADTGNISTKIDTLAGAIITDATVSLPGGTLAGRYYGSGAVPSYGASDQWTVLRSDSTGRLCVNTETVAVTNSGTFAVQVDGDALASLQLLDDAVTTLGTSTYTEATSKGITIGAVRRDADTTLVNTTNEFGPLQMDANGRLKVEAFSGETLPVSLTSTTVTGTVAVTQSGTWDEVGINDSGNSITVDNGGTFAVQAACTNAGTFAVQVDGTALTKLTDIETNTDSGAVVGNGAALTAQRVTLANDSTGIVALTTSTASIGKLASNTGVTIGAVEIAAAQTLATVTTCSTVTTLTGGAIAHDSADSGNGHKVAAKATASVLGATPVAAADRTDLFAGTDGVLITRPYTSLEDIISERKTNTDGAATAMTGAFAATASQRIYLTTLAIANSSATAVTVDIQDGSGGTVLFTVPVPAGAGVVISFPVPLRFTANTAAAFDGSAAATTLTVSMVGFKSKA